MVIKRLFKNKLFLIGFLFIFGLFSASLLYFFIKHDQIPSSGLLFNDYNQAIRPPYSMKTFPPFGTDIFGRDVLFVMIVGAKYTIGAAVIITLLRVLPSTIMGFILHFYLRKIEKPLASIIDAANFFPITLLAFMLLKWICLDGMIPHAIGQQPMPYSFWERVMIFILVLASLTIPSLTLLISKEINLIMNKEFISCSRTLGAANFHLIKKHVRPFLVPQLFIIALRELIQTLVLLSHLGVLGIFMGGVGLKEDLFQLTRPVSLSNEWAGSLGDWWDFILTAYPWLTFVPVLFFTLTILAAKCMLVGLKQVVGSDSLQDARTTKKAASKSTTASPDLFSFAKQDFQQ
ncbi:peptide ABC transporter permease [Falsibacillus pallidus]|uniref:peptide ABC transporter permease n=1 Tax=Falsibacillus pallidus TaxID=493781 RepID=UPI003D960AFF